MDRGNDALGDAPMVPLVRGTVAAGSGVRASVHRMVAQLGQSVGKVTIRPASRGRDRRCAFLPSPTSYFQATIAPLIG
jgi:hypothetical protein